MYIFYQCDAWDKQDVRTPRRAGPRPPPAPARAARKAMSAVFYLGSAVLASRSPLRTRLSMVESIFLACSLITSCIQIGGWAVAYALRTEKFYDILGGLNFLAVAAFSAATAAGWEADARKVAATVIFCCSRSWLLIFLAWRAHERGGDARFDGVKDKPGLFLVFWVMQA